MASTFRPAAVRFSALHTTFRSSAIRSSKPLFQRRFQTTVAEGAKEAVNEGAKQAELTGFAKLWNSPVGPKTVHFWAPIMKWGVVLAGVADFARPAEQLSLSQNAALLCTGALWTRWCFVIRPQNYFLATVNFFLFCVGSAQCARVLMYQRSQKNKPLSEELKDAAATQAEKVKSIAKDPKAALTSAEKSS